MKEQDIIKGVDGVDVTTMDLDSIVNDHIIDKEGTKVKIKIYRPTTKDTLTLEITRRQVEAEYIKSEMLENKTGYISVSSFAVATTKQFTTAVENLKKEGAKKPDY